MTPWDFNIRHVSAFVKTVELGTLLAASKAVNLSQPAVTQAILGLEEQLNCELFRRQSDGMAPTEAATLIFPRFQASLSHLNSSRITSSQVRAFVALANNGSYAQASHATGLASASLHRAVSDLELAISQKLVERRGRGLKITQTGRSVLRRFKLAQSELFAAIQEIAILKGENDGRIAIGAMPLCRARLLPTSIVAFQKDALDSDVIVTEGSHAELVEPLRDGDLDIMIGALRDPPPGPDLVQEELFVDQPIVIARASHPLAKRDGNSEISLEELASYRWCIPRRGIPLRERWQNMFEEAGIAVPEIRVECSSVIIIRQILMKTDCLTVLSPDQVVVELEADWLSIIRSAPLSSKRTIGVTYRNGWRPTSAQQQFLEVLRANA